jgi:WXG100 protein secretion system (Wss), protein YukD
METVLITLVGPARRVDLKLPAEVPIGDIFPKLLELSGAQGVQPQATFARWGLILPVKGQVLPPNRSLRECGVVDGNVLALQDGVSFMAQQQAAAQPFQPKIIQPSAHTGGIGVKWNIPNG